MSMQPATLTKPQKAIISAVDCSIKALIDLFHREPTRFFTENDVVCSFHHLLENSLESLGVGTVPDIDDKPHSLIHCEFATVFRCDMKDNQFTPKLDTDPTPNNGKFRRGHHDVVVLNPDFIRRHSYASVKGQTYTLVRDLVRTLTEDEPAILYGIELVYRRDPIKRSRGPVWDKSASRFVAEVTQDANKLKSSVESKHVMKKARMLAFLKGTTDNTVLDFIRSNLEKASLVTLVTTN